MYFWKCWYESRYRFLAWTALATLAVRAFAYVKMPGFAPSPTMPYTPGIKVGIWLGLLNIAEPLQFFSVIAALALGSGGVGEEFSVGASEFLFTRPRKRKYFVWVSWVTGAVELVVAVAIAVLFSMGFAFWFTHNIADWHVTGLIPLSIPTALIVYGLTCFASACSKSGRNGVAISMGLILIYNVAIILQRLQQGAIRHRSEAFVPSWWFHMLPTEWTHSTAHFPIVATLAWTAAALIFPLVTQKIVEWREI